MRGTVEGLDRGVVGTKATIEKMHKLVALGKLDPTFQKIATWIRTSVPSDRRGSGEATADAIFDWVAKHGIFQRDPFQIEKIEHPIEAMRPIIQARQAGKYTGPGLFVGDCDTFAIVTATLGVRWTPRRAASTRAGVRPSTRSSSPAGPRSRSSTSSARAR